MHAKQRNPSRIQAQEVAQKGPECDAKVCLTRPSNPLKTLGPEPRLVCFVQRSNPIYRQSYRALGSRAVDGKWQLLPRLAWTSGPREHGVDDACETAKPQQDSSPRGGPKRSRMRRQGVPNPTFEPVKNTRTWASAGMLHPTFKPLSLGWYASSNVQTLYRHYYRALGSAMHAKQRNPSRIQDDSSPRGGPKRSRMQRQGVPNPTFEPVKNTRTWASAGMLHPRSNPVQTLLPHPRQRDACETAKPQQDSSPRGGPKRSRMRRQGVPNPTFESVKNTIVPKPWQRLRNSEIPSNGVFPEGPECDAKVCLTRSSNPLKTL